MGKVLTKQIGEYIIRHIKYKKMKQKYGRNDIKITKKIYQILNASKGGRLWVGKV